MAAVFPKGPPKNAKAGEPEGSSALARAAYGRGGRGVKRLRARKSAHVATFRRVNAGGRYPGRADGEKGPNSAAAEAGPRRPRTRERARRSAAAPGPA